MEEHGVPQVRPRSPPPKQCQGKDDYERKAWEHKDPACGRVQMGEEGCLRRGVESPESQNQEEDAVSPGAG